jgi:hypothetical protein
MSAPAFVARATEPHRPGMPAQKPADGQLCTDDGVCGAERSSRLRDGTFSERGVPVFVRRGVRWRRVWRTCRERLCCRYGLEIRC